MTSQTERAQTERAQSRVSQTKVFTDGEGDAWFARNRAALAGRSAPDWVELLVSRLADHRRIASACDLGCANGWRLERLKPLLAPGARLCGIDASRAAIADGRARYPAFELGQGALSTAQVSGSFELAIASFVLHWVDRADLAQTIAAIDRLVAWQGYLVIADFLPDRPERRAYHHLASQDVWTYKQDYAQAFTGLGLYRELARVTFAHDATTAGDLADLRIAPVASPDRCAAVLLQKTTEGYRTT